MEEEQLGALPVTPGKQNPPAQSQAQPPTQPPARTRPRRRTRAQASTEAMSAPSGNEWQEAKQRFIRAAARTGNPTAFVGLLNEWRDMEKYKVSKHMKAALMASQMGNMGAAAAQLQAAGYFLSPGTRGVVSPGPEGSFMVKNYDENGNMQGGYALKPNQIAQMALAYEDTEGFLNWQTRDTESKNRIEQNWEKTKAYVGTQQAQARKLDLQAQREALGLAWEEMTLADRVNQEALATAKLRAELDGTILDNEGQALTNAETLAEIEIKRAELALKEAEVEGLDAAKAEAFNERIQEGIEEAERILEQAADANPNAADFMAPGLMDEAAPDATSGPPAGPGAANPLMKMDPQTGQYVPDLKARDGMAEVMRILLASNEDMGTDELVTASMRLLFSMDNQVMFNGADANQTPGRAATSSPGVEIDGKWYDLSQASIRRLEPMIMAGREAMLRTMWENMPEAERMEDTADSFVELFLMKNGRGFSPFAAADRLRARREQAQQAATSPETAIPESAQPAPGEIGPPAPPGMPNQGTRGRAERRGQPGALSIGEALGLGGGPVRDMPNRNRPSAEQPAPQQSVQPPPELTQMAEQFVQLPPGTDRVTVGRLITQMRRMAEEAGMSKAEMDAMMAEVIQQRQANEGR